MKVLNYLFKVLSWIVIAVIVIYIAVAAPILMGFRPVVVLSGSMKPTFPIGSIVYYHKCSFEELQAGDPITFRAGNAMVTHRITTVNGISRTVVTKGDKDKIVGKATKFAIPYAGYFVTYGKKPIAIALMAAILLINYTLENFCAKQKGEKKDEEKKE